MMLIRAGGGTFRKLSIPRDTLAEIPGQGPQKINSAYALGGAKLAVETVEETLGIDVDQVAIIDFDGFRQFVDTIGGITVEPADQGLLEHLRRRLQPRPGEGRERPRRVPGDHPGANPRNSCGKGEFTGTDVERAQFQQLILDGIKGKLTSITSAPLNFIKGPLIGWNAPKAMVSSMGMLSMPQFVISAATGGGGGTDVLTPSRTTEAGNLVVAPKSAPGPPRSCSARTRRAIRTARRNRARRPPLSRLGPRAGAGNVPYGYRAETSPTRPRRLPHSAVAQRPPSAAPATRPPGAAEASD